ncbi:MAG TPA: type II toxin-antitoxin system YafQ family toxin [Candidatus Dojkabacteria bacterium]|nr:type II toxin-antitoxin system YafQ family toxin [Candidatus Dojkabacteria bacterium]
MSKPISFTSKFKKHYLQRILTNKNLLKQTEKRIKLFYENSQNPILHSHILKGKKNRLKAFSISGDYRIIYEEFSDHYRFLDIGRHNQVYGT